MTIETYRNFRIRPEQMIRVPPHLQGLWQAHMAGPGEEWKEISIIVDTEEDAMRIARQCVDYQYRVEVWEFVEGRKYSPMKDGNIPAFD